MKRLILKMQGASGKTELFILPTDNHSKITELIEFYGLEDYKLIDWKIETVTILN